MKAWQGPSLIDGAPIMVCLSGLGAPSQNRKTGPVVHAWIVPLAEPMHTAVKSGSDTSVCGDCRRRPLNQTPPIDDTPRQRWEVACPGHCSECMVCSPSRWSMTQPKGVVVDAHGSPRRRCYVTPWQVPKRIHELYAGADVAGAQAAHDAIVGAGRMVRLGAVGDPAAVPLGVWCDMIPGELWGPAYTQRWWDPSMLLRRDHMMASVETLNEALEARSMGWRTFRVRG